MTTIVSPFSSAPEDYLELVRRLPLRPVRTKTQHGAAMRLIRELGGREDLTQGQADYLTMLARAVEDYESRQPGSLRGTSTPLEILTHIMEERGVTQAALARLIGRSAASDVLRGKRELSKMHIRTLAKHFQVSPALFFDAA